MPLEELRHDAKQRGWLIECSHGTASAGKSSGQPADESGLEMLLAVAAVLAILWVVLFFAVHITSFAIHIVLILAIISLIAHLFTSRKTA
jgi:multidrug efflux pump subunit AcrB